MSGLSGMLINLKQRNKKMKYLNGTSKYLSFVHNSPHLPKRWLWDKNNKELRKCISEAIRSAYSDGYDKGRDCGILHTKKDIRKRITKVLERE